MDNLVALGEFVGLGNATPARPDGGETVRQAITIRAAANNLATVLSSIDQNSLRAMMQALPNLVPVSLEAERVSGIAEDPPFDPIIRVHPSAGQILWTSLCAFKAALPPSGGNFESIGGAFADKTLDNVELNTVTLIELGDPAVYIFKLTRAGIPSTGITVLEKDFLFRVSAPPDPPKPEHPAPPGGIQPTTSITSVKVQLLNCHSSRRSLDVRARDLTLGEDYSPVGTLDAQYDENDFCPAQGSSPIEIPLTDKHWHEIVALDSEMPACIINEGDPIDPHNVSCWREHIVIFGDKNGNVFRVIVP
jgi:hypothetical protein